MSTNQPAVAQRLAPAIQLPSASQSPETILPLAETKPELQAKRQAFLEKYKFRHLGDAKVEFVLPAGLSVLDMMREAKQLGPSLYGHITFFPEALERAEKDSAFTAKAKKDTVVRLNGIVKDSENKTREEQARFLVDQGLKMPAGEHLFAAGMLYFIATGKDLFEKRYARVMDLFVCRTDFTRHDGIIRSKLVFTAANLPPEK